MGPADGGDRAGSRVGRGRWKMVGLLLGAMILAGSLTAPAQDLRTLPDRLRLVVGERAALRLDLPWPLDVSVDRRSGLRVDGRTLRSTWAAVPGGALSLQPVEAGIFHVDLRFLGIVPIRHLTVQALPRLDVVPGGQSIGVVFNRAGVVVVRHAPFVDRQGKRVDPAVGAGVRIGDRIVAVDGRPVDGATGVEAAVEAAGRSGRSVRLTIARRGRLLVRRLYPSSDPAVGRYLMGVWVEDGEATGLGTLTFYDPVSDVFGALGHVVANDRGHALRFSSASLLPAMVAGMERGRRGTPGEKLGVFVPGRTAIGTILQNTPLGVFGRLDRIPGGGLLTSPIPIASEEQVHPGPARVLTVVAGRTIQSFGIDIERVVPQNRPESKGLLLHVTDPRLLAATGGIVQGMSGSPILQDGRLVGAITHVFVNDPTRGYGVLAEWMAEEAHLIQAPVPKPGFRLTLP